MSGLLRPAEVAARYRVTPAAVLRWISTGVGAAGGGRVRLAARRVGGRWVIDPAAVDEFVSACNAGPTPAPVVASARRGAADRAALARALKGG